MHSKFQKLNFQCVLETKHQLISIQTLLTALEWLSARKAKYPKLPKFSTKLSEGGNMCLTFKPWLVIYTVQVNTI